MLWWTLQQLKSSSASTRREAVAKLEDVPLAQIAPALGSTLRNRDPQVRLAVVHLLSRGKEESAVKLLVQALGDKHLQVRQTAAEALRKNCDTQATEALVAALQDPEFGVRWSAMQALKTLGWKPANELESAAAAVADGEFQRAAVYGSMAIDLLVTAIESCPYDRRAAAVEALSRIEDERVLKPLLAAVQSPETSVRAAAVAGLGQVRSPEAIEALVARLKDPDSHVRAATAEALGKSGDSAVVELLTGALTDASWEVRASVVGALRGLKDPRAVEPLTACLNDPDTDVREATVTALGHLGDSRAIGPLIKSLTDGHKPVREGAAKALDRIDKQWERTEAAQKAVPSLNVALRDPEYWVRQAAKDALTAIREGRATPQSAPSSFEDTTLIDAADEKRRGAAEIMVTLLQDYDRELRQAAAEGLGRIGDVRALEPLQRALNDADPGVRRAASAALARLQGEANTAFFLRAA